MALRVQEWNFSGGSSTGTGYTAMAGSAAVLAVADFRRRRCVVQADFGVLREGEERALSFHESCISLRCGQHQGVEVGLFGGLG